jgi:hypothetical protein
MLLPACNMKVAIRTTHVVESVSHIEQLVELSEGIRKGVRIQSPPEFVGD